MGVLAMCLVVVLFVAMGFESDVDDVLEALKHPVTHGRHGSDELSVEALRARCQADTLRYYPISTTAAGPESRPDRPPFLRGEMPEGYDAESFEATPEIVGLANRCGQAWAALVEAADTASSSETTSNQ